MTLYDLGKVVGEDGAKGDDGNGIASITKTGQSGLVDTYTITFTDGSTTTFTVTNGSDASVTIQTSWGSTTSNSKVPSEKLTKDTLDTKIAKSSTTGLVKNDGTIDTSTYLTSSALTNYVQKSSTTGLIKNDGTIDTSTYLTQLKIGSTANKPVITTTNGVLTTGSFGTSANTFAEGNHTHSNYISTSSTTGLIKNDGTVMTSGTGSSNYSAGNHTHSGYVSATLVTSWSSTVSDSNVASEKLVKDTIDDLIGEAIEYIQQ